MTGPVVEFRNALEQLDAVRAESIFDRAIAVGSAIHAVETLVVPALEQMGEAWRRGEVALSQVNMSGRFCERLVDRVLPPSDPDCKSQPRSAVATLCDTHELGKRIVYAVMRVNVDELVERAQRDQIRILLISVLMLPSALRTREVVERLKSSDPALRVVVGGAPFLFDRNLRREVGADAMSTNAGEAVEIVVRMMGELA